MLPFRLTEHQERAIAEIDADLERTVPMQRLLQGDVGSGKTVVALYALLRAVESGRQGALMAPTETLAEQHFLTIEEPCRELGVSCALLTGSVKHELNADVVVGTHALIQEGVELDNLAVAVVDEQHRFGVEQRKALTAGRSPHVLHMTATPIPRTLALTVYGDLAVSEIARPPANRKPIKTAWVTEERSAEAYSRLRKHLDAGRQAYVVCPLIEESETSQARAAEAEAERLRRAELRGYRVGLLHGRLRPAERRELMARFKARELDVLVATTVIEVGVDVPNATIMIVQEADRFGLAQLHQLRGRVGRGAEQSYCLLISRAREDLTDAAVARLEALVRTTDGFELAEADLDIRGGGQLLGTRQSGLTDLQLRAPAQGPAAAGTRACARGRPRRRRRARSPTRSTGSSPASTSAPADPRHVPADRFPLQTSGFVPGTDCALARRLVHDESLRAAAVLIAVLVFPAVAHAKAYFVTDLSQPDRPDYELTFPRKLAAARLRLRRPRARQRQRRDVRVRFRFTAPGPDHRASAGPPRTRRSRSSRSAPPSTTPGTRKRGRAPRSSRTAASSRRWTTTAPTTRRSSRRTSPRSATRTSTPASTPGGARSATR